MYMLISEFVSLGFVKVVGEVRISKEDFDKLKEEAKANKEHMLQVVFVYLIEHVF